MSETLDIERAEEILSINFDYYKKLSQEDKQRFTDRLEKFLKGKEFFPRDGVELSGNMDEIKTFVSAAAIQVTFGLEEYVLGHFSKIFIFPSSYYSKITHKYHIGEANPLGALVFSWKDLKSGYQDGDDKINVGVHEMAHALLMSKTLEEFKDKFFSVYFDKWLSVTHDEFMKLEKHEASFFRDYAGTNRQEFFAVCLECFFEAPAEFKEKHPEIYRQTCILLNQDPSVAFNSSVAVRDQLITEPKQVEPKNLVFNTSGKSSIANASSFFILLVSFAFVFLGAAKAGLGLPILISSVFLIIFIVTLMGEYPEFYFYDNAFEVKFERRGKETGNSILLCPDQMISVAFVSKTVGKSTIQYLDVVCLQDKELHTYDWPYEHLKSNDIQLLAQNMKAFCDRNIVTFRGPVRDY